MSIKTYSTTAANNTALFAENQTPSSLNDGMRQVQADIRTWFEDAEWIDWGDTPSRASSSSFKITGDVTSRYQVNRKIKLYDSSTLYGTVTAASYSAPDTTITVDNSSLTASLSSIALAIISATNNSLPNSLTIPGTLSVSGAAICNTSLTVQGATTLSGSVNLTTTLNVAGATTLSGAATLKSTLDVQGTTVTIKGDTSGPGKVRLYETSTNGINYVGWKAPTSIANDFDLIMPSALGSKTSNILNYTSAGVSSFIGAGWEFIQSQTASTSSSLDFNNLSSSYIAYLFVTVGVYSSFDNDQFGVRFSDDNGSTFYTTTDYKYVNAHVSMDVDGVFYGRSTGTSRGEIILNVGNTASQDELYIFSYLFGAGVNIKPHLVSIGGYNNNQNDAESFLFGSLRRGTAMTTNGIRFLFANGNITAGTIYQFGLRI